MLGKIFKRKAKKRNFKLESLHRDIKAKTIKIQRYRKNSDSEESIPDKEKYCKMIKIEDLKKILENHFDEKIISD